MLAPVIGLLFLHFKKIDDRHVYKTKNILVIVVDGARYTETWGTTRQYIPHRAAMLKQGVLCSGFYNEGETFTVPGHTAIATGFYEQMSNNGTQYPQEPSFLQRWRKASNAPADKAWLITTKDKLEILSDCINPVWKGQFRPETDCGVSGLASGYREDSVTFQHIRHVLSTDHPHLLMVNFKQPDAAAHATSYSGYLKGIMDTDNYIYGIWQQLQSDPFYKDQTTLFVTNDHGRHTGGHRDGFISHGDHCDGCMHIELFGMGPDFKQDYDCATHHSQIDLTATIAEMMGFELPGSKGKVIEEIFDQREQ